MIEIINHGIFKTIYVKCCTKCNCTFRFDQSDVLIDFDDKTRGGIECPECGEELSVNLITDKEKNND